MRRRYKNSNGFTMAEMLITVAIIVILCAFGFVAVIHHQRNLKRMEMDETAQEIFIAAQNHLTAAQANGQWDSFLESTKDSDTARGTFVFRNGSNKNQYDPTKLDKEKNDSSNSLFYSLTESSSDVQNGAMEYILPEGAIDETLRGHHFYIEYDAMSGTVYGVFYTDSDHAITADDAMSVSRTDANARRDYRVDNKRTIIGYYGGALGELKNPGDLYTPSVAVRNAESLVLYVVDKNYYRPTSASAKSGSTQSEENRTDTFKTKLKLTFEGAVSGPENKVEKVIDPDNIDGEDSFSKAVLAADSVKTFSVVVPGRSAEKNGGQTKEDVHAKYYAIVLDSIVRDGGHFADLFPGFIPGEDITITVTLTSDNGGEDVSQTVTVNSLFNSVRTESNFLGLGKKTVVTVSNARHLENLSSEVSGADFANKQIVEGETVETVSVVRDLYWDEDSAAEENGQADESSDSTARENTTAFLTAIASATGMNSKYGYCAWGSGAAQSKENIQVYPYIAASGVGENADAENSSSDTNADSSGTTRTTISRGACYGITNTAIKTFEGNNHVLAAFRFEGSQKAALINEAADGLQITDLVLTDTTAVVTGKAGTENTGSNSSAAVLMAKAKSGSIMNVAVRWYEETAASDKAALEKQLQGSGLQLANGLQGCRVYSANGIAAVVASEVDAAKESNSSKELKLENVTVKTISKDEPVAETSTVTANLGIEGEIASAFIGKVTSGTVTIDNSGKEEDKKSGITVAGQLTLTADKGTAANRAAGAYIGVQEAGTTVTLNTVQLTMPVLESSAVGTDGNGGASGGLMGITSGKLTLTGVNLSAHTLEVTGASAAGGAIGRVNGGETGISGLTILTDKATTDCGEAQESEQSTGSTETNSSQTSYGIRITAQKGCAGGLIGSTGSGAKVNVADTAVSGSGAKDQVWSGSSAGGLIGKDEATTTIKSSMASLYVRAEGNGGAANTISAEDGAGGLIGSASGTTTIEDSYSGGRTAATEGKPAYQDIAGQPNANVSAGDYTQGRYNIYLAGGNGAAGGLVGKSTGTLTIKNSYSTSSIAVNTEGAYAGGLVGQAESLKAGKTYCTGRVYKKGSSTTETNDTTTENSTPTTNGNTGTDSTKATDTSHIGYYAGQLGSLEKEGSDTNYYLKGMNGAPEEAVGTYGTAATGTADTAQTADIDEKILTGADYYAENCPLTQGVASSQKAYYFDASAAGEAAHYENGATKYPFRTVTTAFARFLYHPVTGAKITDADQNSAKYAQIGDWEVPEETSDANFGLIYYEKIWNGTTNSLDSTFYYHGYMLKSGANAKTATYDEISSAESFVTEKDRYVAESGYLLLVKNGEEKDRYVCIAKGGDEKTETYGQISRKITDFSTYPLSNENVAALEGYTAYNVTLSINDYYSGKDGDKTWMFAPSGNTFGVLLAIRKIENNTQQPSVAAFTYIPFFADALKAAEKGELQTVSKADSSKTGTDPQAIIRSADQLKNFCDYENHSSNTGFLTQSSDRRIIEQQLDITFDKAKVTFFKNGAAATDSADAAYQSPTLKQIGWANAVFRSTLRPGAAADSGDYYVLDGLRDTFVTTVYGELCNLQVTNMKAAHFLGAISDNNANVHDITITDAQFGAGDDYNQLTDAGFAGEMKGSGTVSNCKIINASIYGTGFIKNTSNSGTIKQCYIINATIWGDGFITSNCASIENCGLYADPSLYSSGTTKNYSPLDKGHGTYDYLSIGIAPGGSRSAADVAGFVQEQTTGEKQSIKNCFVAGSVYGSKNVSGFIGNAKCGVNLDGCYANVVINADGNASGFAGQINDDSTQINNCHALGKIESAQAASGMVQTVNTGTISKCYEAFWSVSAKTWYPFCKEYNGGTAKDNYYLTDCALSAESMELKDYTGKVTGKSYDELKNLSIDDAGHADSDHTVGYYKYMSNDDQHRTYPYPMPQGQTAYGDWSYQAQDRYSLLYYEKVDGSYYFHGVSTADGVTYKTDVETSGSGLEDGLLTQSGKTVSESGYVLVTGADSAWSTFGRADNTETSSLPTDVNTQKTTGKTEIFTEASAELLDALKNLGSLEKNTADGQSVDKAYVFQLDKYLSYTDPDTTKNFASWQTLTQESEGIGITVYSAKGNIPVARFSFQPFFADTVKAAKVPGSGTANEKALNSTFVATKDGAAEHDYRVRSLSQLESLSKWDGQKFDAAGKDDLKNAFDKESAKRFSYLSTSSVSAADNVKTHLKIRQDMDIQLGDSSDVEFQCLDGTYSGRKYGDSSVQLKNLRKDFAHYVTSTGKIESLVLDSAKYGSSGTTTGGEKDMQHGANEFVEYNYGTLSDITVQNSKSDNSTKDKNLALGSAGLVYQNGDVTKNVLQKTTIGCPSVGTGGTYVSTIQIDGKSEDVYRYEFKYEYSTNAAAKTGVVTNCTVKNSDIAGAGLVWRNKGGYISGSKVEGCHKVGASGFAEYNESTSVSAPKTETEYQYWIGMSKWTEDRSSYSQASDELISKNSWKKVDTEGQVTYAVSARIENCKVASCEWKTSDQPGIGENGFVGINRVNKEGTAGSTVSGGEAVLLNCEVADAGAAVSGFAGENLNGASITNCQVYGSKAYGSSSMGSAGISQSAGFIITNGAGSTIDSCSFTGQVQGLKIGGFVLTNQGTIKNSYANVLQGWNKNDNFAGAAGFVFDNAGQIEYCHSLGQFGGSQNSRSSKNGIAAGFVMNNKTGATISNSYTAMWEVYEPKNNMAEYHLFAGTAGGTFTKCYAMKPSSGSWSSPSSGISYVTGNGLKTYTADLGTETKGQTIAYTAGIGDYPFPVSVNIKNYGDWYIQWKTTDWGNSGTQTSSTYSVNLSAGAGVFSEEAAASAKAAAAGDGSEANAISLAALDDAGTSAANSNAADAASGTSAAVSDIVLTLQPEESEEEETAKTELDLSEFKPTRKGWKLLGWLITSPSELADQTAKITASDIVTKISKASDGTAAYELEKGAKSYHYAPDAVVTVTQDMTLAAVWVPDDDTVARAQDGTLRMDENGNILDAEEAAGDAASASSDATTEQSNNAAATDGQTSSDAAGDNAVTGTTQSGEKAADSTANAADQKVTDPDASQTGQDTSKKTTDGKTTDASISPSGLDSSKASNGETANALDGSSNGSSNESSADGSTASAADGASEPAAQASEQAQGGSDAAPAAAVKAASDPAREAVPETGAAGTAEPANESSTETSEEQTE